MFGSIGGAELFLIFVLALLLFGPRKLPQIGRSIGKALAEFRGAAHEFKSGLEREVEMEQIREVKSSLSDARKDVAEVMEEAAGLTVPREAPSAPEKQPPAHEPKRG